MANQPELKGRFEVALDHATVKINEQPQNEVVIKVNYTGDDEPLVLLTITATCGRAPNALLESKNENVAVKSNHPDARNLSKQDVKDANKAAWRTKSAGIALTKDRKQVMLTLDGFRCRTPPGDAEIEVAISAKAASADIWTSKFDPWKLSVPKTAPQEPTLLYFAISPDFVLQAGATDVWIEICATGFSKVKLTRNNEEVSAWADECQKLAKGEPAKFQDRPSITTVYHLELTKGAASQKGNGQDVYRTVQVISPGWNRLALSQGYPAWLFVADLGQGQRLYGIFIDPDGKATLHSSATGVDNWWQEEGAVPNSMKNSPGVVFDGKLWLIGGSSFDEDAVGDEVWCYEKQADTNNWEWEKKAQLGLGAHGVGQRACHACTTAPAQGKEAIWLLGGYNNGICYQDVWTCDGAKWGRAAEPAWPARFKHAAAVRRRASDAEVWVYGGLGNDHAALSDLWMHANGNWSSIRGPQPSPGQGKAVALTTAPQLPIGDDSGITMLGTFLLPGSDNVTTSRILKWQDGNAIWEAEEVGAGWERFAGAAFGMQAISFNGFLFVWTLHRDIERAPRLNVLVSP
jgi:hypothetical protein